MDHSVLSVPETVQVMNGHAVEGEELANLVERMIGALNARDIPTAGSILEHFNQVHSMLCWSSGNCAGSLLPSLLSIHKLGCPIPLHAALPGIHPASTSWASQRSIV